MQNTNLKYLTCLLIAAFTTAVYISSDTNTATAGDTARQVVTITIPPIRALYIDEEETIVAIFSNVQVIADEKLQAFKSGTEIAVSDEIIAQYKELLPRIDWSKIGWIYPQAKPDQKAAIKIQLKEKSEETYSHLKEDFYSNSIIKAKISNEEIFENVSKLNSFPRPSHKENYNIRVTVLDGEEDLSKVSVEYFLMIV